MSLKMFETKFKNIVYYIIIVFFENIEDRKKLKKYPFEKRIYSFRLSEIIFKDYLTKITTESLILAQDER